MIDNIKVIIPIRHIDGIIETCKKANVIPTANASILVAIANAINSFILSSLDCSSYSSSPFIASIIICTPIKASNPNAIQ